MNIPNTNKVTTVTWFHMRTFIRGLGRVIESTLVAGAAAGSVYGFTLISGETGYAAVWDFVVSSVMLVIAMVGVYAVGHRGRRYKKYKGLFVKEVK